jgi:hypothetical protein
LERRKVFVYLALLRGYKSSHISQQSPASGICQVPLTHFEFGISLFAMTRFQRCSILVCPSLAPTVIRKCEWPNSASADGQVLAAFCQQAVSLPLSP